MALTSSRLKKNEVDKVIPTAGSQTFQEWRIFTQALSLREHILA